MASLTYDSLTSLMPLNHSHLCPSLTHVTNNFLFSIMLLPCCCCYTTSTLFVTVANALVFLYYFNLFVTALTALLLLYYYSATAYNASTMVIVAMLGDTHSQTLIAMLC